MLLTFGKKLNNNFDISIESGIKRKLRDTELSSSLYVYIYIII